MKMTPVESSNIKALGYDPADETLQADFLNGTTYIYFAVPPKVFEDLMAAESKGSAFNTLVKKGGFSFRKQP